MRSGQWVADQNSLREAEPMRIGAGLLLIAVGAILRFGIATVTTHGVAIQTIGDILILVGVLGLVLWLVVWAPWTRSRRPAYREEAPVDRGETPVYREERRVYRAETPADEVLPPRRYPADSPYEDDYRR
jgi:hypothetical protein